ncbi:MAG: hypothetical protein JSU90_01110 [Nitrospiraceae bacterium]|nr:MAG: hypothetical protein JSU90_01110 [Nitrospiraceae bacterium]
MKIKKEAGIAGPAVATAGGISTTSMVACCAHHLTDVLPLVGASAAAVFLSQYQSVFLTAGVLSNLVGITLMLKIIQKQGLYRQKQTILSALMRLNMTRSFYAVCALSIVTLLVTLYQSF